MSGEGVEVNLPPRRYPHPHTPQGQNFAAASLPGVTSTPQYYKEEVKEALADDIRKKIGAKMNKETLLCDIDKFLTHYGPRKKMNKQDLLDCIDHLINSGLLIRSDQQKLYWRDFKNGPRSCPKKKDTDTNTKDLDSTDSDTKNVAASSKKKASNTQTKDSDGKQKKRDPGTQKNVTEDEAFANLQPIIKAINEFVGVKKGNPYVFELVPSKNLTSEIAKASHRMAGALVDAAWNTEHKLPVCFIYKPHEYKLYNTMADKRKNRLQTAGDCHCVMNEDPRRMHIFAVSFEDDRMSVWYFSRSHSMKTLSFNWIGEDIEKCIQVFLAFALATPKELGVDDTVTLAPRDTSATVGTAAADQHYIYRCPVVPDSTDAAQPTAPVTEFKYFKTVQIIKEMRPYNIAGRNTRIWKVVEVKGPNTNEVVSKEQFVLKDVWLEAKRATEAENLELIFKALEELVDKSKKKWGDNWKKMLFDEDDRFIEFDEVTKDELRDLLTDQKYKSLFLTKLHAWKGETSLDVCESAMHSSRKVPLFQGDAVLTAGPIQSAARTPALPGLASVLSKADNEDDEDEESDPSRRFAPKTQSRFIYKEICTDLDTVGTLGNLMDILNQALQALRIMFCAGWVHRDISSNNILVFNDDGVCKVKLADLEFSQTVDHGTAQADPRTGTPYFMPVEIMTRKYLLESIRAGPGENPKSTMARQLKLQKGTVEYDTMKDFLRIGDHDSLPADANLDAIPDSKTPLRYNFQHDLESLWWIVIYFITARVDHKASQQAARKIFQKRMKASTERKDLINEAISAKSYLGLRLHEHLLDSFLTFINGLRSNLRTEYQVREVFGRMLVPHTYADIHAIFANAFAVLLADNTAKWKQIPILPASALAKTEEPAAGGTKRGRDNDDGLTSASKKTKRHAQ